MDTQLHHAGQFNIEQNVEYKIISTPKVVSIFQGRGVSFSEKAVTTMDLELVKQEILSHGFSEEELQKVIDSCARDIFTENKLGRFMLKRFRKLAPHPLTNDGTVKKGFLNKLSAYGLQINGLTGSVGKKRDIKNLVTNAGFAGIASRINGAGSEAAFTYIAVGTGTTAAAAGNTTLETEISDSGLSRASATASRVTTTQTNDTAQLVVTFTVSGTKAVTESGVLNASSSGVLLCRQVFSAINVISGDSLQVTWKIKAA